MPLPWLINDSEKQCVAKSKRTGERCRNPRAYSCRTCRFHGARKPESIKRSSSHPCFKHGWETLQAKQYRSKKLAELYEIETKLRNCGLLLGKAKGGRRPT